MAGYTHLPTLDVDFIRPRRFSFDTPGSALEGGRNGLGEAITIGLSGGPLVSATYQECFVQAPEQHEYFNWLAARLNGSFRFINVPLLTDWAGPFPFVDRTTPQPVINGIPHGDGALFSDDSGYSQATVYGLVAEDATLNAGVVKIQVFGAVRPLRWSDWFSFKHPNKGWRATRYWDVMAVDRTDPDAPIYTLAIEVPLREAISEGDRVEFARPRFAAKFPAGFTLPWQAEGFWRGNPTLNFIEAF